MSDSDRIDPMAGDSASDEGDETAQGSSSDHGPELDRLPPPAFPPGRRRAVSHRTSADPEPEGDDGGLADALIQPDEPIRRTLPDALDDAFISPDAPFRRREPHDGEGGEDDEEEEEGIVTGIGSWEPEYFPREVARRSRGSEVQQIASLLEELAAGLRKHGSVVLVSETPITAFEGILRGMVAGFLAARSEED